MFLNTFKQAEQFLALHIPNNSKQTFPGELGLKREKYFLHLLGDPQEKLKIIHVAGTSGKGSTCYLISSLLTSQGFKVGFHQSPHLTDVRERFQIYTSTSLSTSNQIISKKEFIFYLNKIIPIVNIVAKTFLGTLTYFEILVGLAYLIFYEKKVDYAVMETGLGGMYDATNVVERSDKLAVLTKIGLDHINILGKTIKEIAFQKAMITNNKSRIISIDQDSEAEKIIREVAEKRKAKIMFIGKDGTCPVCTKNRCICINKISLLGDFQKENASLALTAVKYLGQRDGFLINQKQVTKVFSKVYFPGRFDVKKINGKTVVFDGAHNPQKMSAFINSLIKKFPNKKFNFLLAFKKGKDFQEMLKIIIPKADSIILTSFFTENQDMINASEDPAEILGTDGACPVCTKKYQIIPDLRKAWVEVLEKNEPIVVTGSLYLVGEIFKLIKKK